MPQISVIIPTYNNSGMLSETVESVLTQTLEDLEVIVVDDDFEDHARVRVEVQSDGWTWP